MLGSFVDSLLTRLATIGPTLRRSHPHEGKLKTSRVMTSVGPVRVYDSGAAKPCVVFVPDGPNVIEHYEVLIQLLAQDLRVVCFDMPGFGHSLPRPTYTHSLAQGATAVLDVMDRLGIASAGLAFSCANGFYALQAARIAPGRISNLILSQTPSLSAMHAWAHLAVPRPIHIPVIGQIAAWLLRQRAAQRWYARALPRSTDPQPFQQKAHDAFAAGGCFCLAGVVQGLMRENAASLQKVATPCTVIWGSKDYSHRHTAPNSLHECMPHAELIHFDDCGHFPDIEQPERYASIVIERVAQHA